MHIDTNVYYFMPQIVDTYREEYGGVCDHHIREWSECIAIHIKEWSEFIVAKHLGVVSYAPQSVKLDDAVICDYYRIVDLKQFLVIALQLGIVIDNTTPTIHHDAHRS